MEWEYQFWQERRACYTWSSLLLQVFVYVQELHFFTTPFCSILHIALIKSLYPFKKKGYGPTKWIKNEYKFVFLMNLIFLQCCVDGHNEAEFGMSWCAGFGGSFYNAYFEVHTTYLHLSAISHFLLWRENLICVVFQVMPKQPGFEKRRDLYLLYHYLNHYNLFGSGYRSSAMSIIDDYLRLLKA